MENDELNKDEVIEKESVHDNKIEKEKLELLNRVLSGNLVTKRDKVGFILNNHSVARNSDVELAWLY